MNKICIKIVILFTIVFLLLSVLILAPFPANDSMSMYQQKHLICENIRGKKIIFVGGSGVFYSVDANLLEKQNTGYQTINMGLSAGLGLQFNLNEIKPYINPGDIVILIPEHSNFQNGPQGSVATLLAINSVPKLFKISSLEHLKYLFIFYGLEFIPAKCQNYINDVVLYITKSSPLMSQHGDIITRTAVRDVSNMPMALDIKFDNASYKVSIDLLNEFNNYCINRKAHAVLSFPAIPTPQYEKNKPQLESLYMNLSKDIKMPILSRPEQFVYPVNFFDDTVYHMNMDHKSVNTLKLIKYIKKLYPDLFI